MGERYFYKYKSMDMGNLSWTDELLKGYLYTPSLGQLNDPFENVFDIVDIELMKHLAKNYGTTTPDNVFKSLSTDEKVDVAFLSELFSKEEVWEMVHEGRVKPFIDRVRVQCLSERKDSIGMWTYYSSQFDGFLLEYKEKDFERSISEMRGAKLAEYVSDITPMNYLDDRLFPMNSLTEDAFKQNIFKKYSDWSNEEEFRIVFLLKDPTQALKIEIKPSKLYIGFQLEGEKKKWLLEKCAEYEIPFEEMSKNKIKNLLQERAAQRSIRALAELKVAMSR